jgi:hypothetical protein
LADGAASAIRGSWWMVSRNQSTGVISEERSSGTDVATKPFLRDWGSFRSALELKFTAYVLMPNHYHLQLSLGARGGLAAAMHWLNTGCAIWFNRRYRRQGALFQGRYKAILFDPDECLLTIHYYIHLNPGWVGALRRLKLRRGR